MSSQTIHVIGYAFLKKEGDTTTERLFYAMSRVEMEQQRRKASKENLTINRWYAQTKTGERILGGTDYRLDKNAPRAKVVDCDVCDQHGCIVCNHSGVTTRNHKHKWQAWQLVDIRRDALAKAA